MKHTEISKLFSSFIEAYADIEVEDFDLESNTISEEIYKHIFRIKVSLWKHNIEFNRRKRMALPDIFQDIIALYVKIALKEDFEVILEERSGRLQPDILIKHKGLNLFILEIKTSIGWDRGSINGSIQKRIKELSNEFNIPNENIVYIFQSPWNVNKQFANRYWNIKENTPRELPVDFPFNKIRPLLTADDPYYWEHTDGFNRDLEYIEFSEECISSKSKGSIVVPLELTIKEILRASLRVC